MARWLIALAPLLLLAYSLLRLRDGLDGGRGSGWLWTTGHLLFLGSIVCFALLAVLTPRLLLRVGRPLFNTLRVLATVPVLAGAAAFAWVILGDISPAFREAVRVPVLVTALGPPLLVVGLVLMFGQLARACLGRRWPWTPALVLVGLILISVDLDILPIGAFILLLAVVPLSRAMGGTSPGKRW